MANCQWWELDFRGMTSVVGILLLVAVTVAAAGFVGMTVAVSPPDSPPTAAFEASVDGNSGVISITHRHGDELCLSEISMRIVVDGEPLDEQPPVPFFSAAGFESGPTGPFNSASPDTWQVGETGTMTIAGTNDPDIAPGDTVTIRIHTESATIAELTVTA